MQRKAEQKKVSACCPESGISDTLKESSAAGEYRILQNARKCAQKKMMPADRGASKGPPRQQVP